MTLENKDRQIRVLTVVSSMIQLEWCYINEPTTSSVKLTKKICIFTW